MKKLFTLFVLACSVTLLVSCNSKEKEKAKATADSLAFVAKQDSITRSDRAAKRELLAKTKAEKAEQRRLAWIEMSKTKPSYKDASGKIVYNTAEVSPVYPGGEAEMVRYLNDNVQYPQAALDKGVQGTVFVDFIIDEKGKVRDAVASETIGDDIDQTLKDEALRVVNSMPTWEPGKQRGKPVDVYFSVPITFELQN